MTSFEEAIGYYIRVFANIDLGTGAIIGVFHLMSFVGVATMFFLLLLASLILRADSKSAKNRFMTLMLVTEGLSAGLLTLYWLYPWPLSAVKYLFLSRCFVGFLGVQRMILYLAASTFYVDKPWAKRISSMFGSMAILIVPALAILFLYLLIRGETDMVKLIGDMLNIYCPSVGAGIGGTYSGNPLPFDPYCPETLSAQYPMYFNQGGVGSISTLLIGIQLSVNLVSTLIMTLLVRWHRAQDNPTVDLDELKAVCLGVQIKTGLGLAAFSMLLLLILFIGRPSPETSIFNPTWVDTRMATLFFIVAPLALAPHILAILIEGVVFTYAVIKHEVMGIDESLRKTFTATIFAGLGGLSFLIGTELMENLIGIGWIGGVLIGVLFFAIRNPLLRLLSSVSAAMMPQALTTAERKYLELYAIAMNDGVITDKERLMLDMQAQSYGIQRKRAAMLEASFKVEGKDE